MPNGLQDIVREVEAVALAAAEDRGISDDELGEILSFLAKVSHVVEQAFRDVLDILIQVQFLTSRDLHSKRTHKLREKVASVLARSHYRDAEEICSRLGHLKETYITELAQFIDPLPGRAGWSGLLGLIEEREGRIIQLIHASLYELNRRLGSLAADDLPELNAYAEKQATEIKDELSALNDFTNRILGLSGRRGLLELVRDRGQRVRVVRAISVLVNEGNIDMSKNTVGRGVIVSGNATARDIKVDANQYLQQGNIDLPALARELEALRQAMKSEAAEPEDDIAVGQIALAQQAAAKGDEKGTLKALKQAGVWTLSVAEKIGVGVATSALKTALGV